MVGWLFFAPWFQVYIAILQARGYPRTQQEVVDPDAAIVLEGLAKIIPEGELSGLAGMQRPKRIGVTHGQQCPITFAGLGLKQGIAHP